MLEFVFEVLGEFIFQIILEALAEAGLYAVSNPQRKPPNPLLAAIGYTVFGAMVGGLSLLIFPNNFVPMPWRITNMLVTPVAAGLLMSALGAWRERRGQERIRIDRFAYGYLFALGLGLVRFFYPS